MCSPSSPASRISVRTNGLFLNNHSVVFVLSLSWQIVIKSFSIRRKPEMMPPASVLTCDHQVHSVRKDCRRDCIRTIALIAANGCCATKRSVFEFSLDLSRACLGKMIIFFKMHKWLKKTVFLYLNQWRGASRGRRLH